MSAPELPTCATCGEPIRLVMQPSTSTAPEVWLHVETPEWVGNRFDARGLAHDATPREPSWIDQPLPGL